MDNKSYSNEDSYQNGSIDLNNLLRAIIYYLLPVMIINIDLLRNL